MAGEPNFEWDPIKERANRAKHGVPFFLAQRAFFDPRRVIAEDLGHSTAEQRYFCFGQVGGGVMTVRFNRARSAKVGTGFASERALNLNISALSGRLTGAHSA